MSERSSTWYEAVAATTCTVNNEGSSAFRLSAKNSVRESPAGSGDSPVDGHVRVGGLEGSPGKEHGDQSTARNSNGHREVPTGSVSVDGLGHPTEGKPMAGWT